MLDIFERSGYKTQNSEHHKRAKNKMMIITNQPTLQKSELFETNGELTSEYTIFQLMIGKQQVSIGTSRKTAN